MFDVLNPLVKDLHDLMTSEDSVTINLHSRSQYPGWENYIATAAFIIDFDINTIEVPILLNNYV